jgi:hypothetical protein
VKKFLLAVLFAAALIIASPHLFSGKKSYTLSFSSEKSLQVGEELRYVVSYSFLNLGEVRLKVKDKKIVNKQTVYIAVAYIDSYKGIPFVDLHQIYETHMRADYFSNHFKALIRAEKYTAYTNYFFDYEKKTIAVKKGRVSPPQVWTDSVTTAEHIYQDGLSIFYFARMNFGKKWSIDVPCFVTEQKVKTRLNFYDEPVKVSIDAVDYDINCVRLDGYTDFVSVFGLTGYFEGWFTNDEASVPVVAKMKVIIGNIRLELKEWKREGWTPPKYRN